MANSEFDNDQLGSPVVEDLAEPSVAISQIDSSLSATEFRYSPMSAEEKFEVAFGAVMMAGGTVGAVVDWNSPARWVGLTALALGVLLIAKGIPAVSSPEEVDETVRRSS